MKKELSNTYFVQDRSSLEELSRLQVQDRMITDAMGGALPEQDDLSLFQRILDVGCGTGSWLIDAAKITSASMLIGIDISQLMVDYARMLATEQGVADRVTFEVMDTLRMIEYPDRFFDLVNVRFAASYVRTWEWDKLFKEFIRVARSQGTIRITEFGADISYSSPALTQLKDIFLEALSASGHTFTSNRYGQPDELLPLLQRYGFQDIQTCVHVVTWRSGTPAGLQLRDDLAKAYRTLVPFFRQWLRLPDNYEQMYEQAMDEMLQPGFEASWRLLTLWAKAPSISVQTQ